MAGLHPHHMVYRSAGGTDDLKNMITLCWNCHRQHHDGFLNIEWGPDGANDAVQFTRKKGYKIL